MKKLQLIDYIVIIEVFLLALAFAMLITRAAPPCTESLDVTAGQNFNQPILTEHNCRAGEVPTNWRDFEAK